MRLLAELGIELKAGVPEDVNRVLVALKLAGVKPLKPRRRSPKNPGDADPSGAEKNPRPPEDRK